MLLCHSAAVLLAAGSLSDAMDAVTWAAGPEGKAAGIAVINLSLAGYADPAAPGGQAWLASTHWLPQSIGCFCKHSDSVGEQQSVMPDGGWVASLMSSSVLRKHLPLTNLLHPSKTLQRTVVHMLNKACVCLDISCCCCCCHGGCADYAATRDYVCGVFQAASAAGLVVVAAAGNYATDLRGEAVTMMSTLSVA